MRTACPACGFANPADFKFCGECGAGLSARASPKVSRDRRKMPRRGAAVEPERRQITVLFCDLVGSTEMSARLDPEALRDVIERYRRVCAAAIASYGGLIYRYLGDGVLAYFGFPTAHEDDPLRAVRAGLDIISGIQRLNASSRIPFGEVELAVRIGVNTGLVVAGDLGSGKSREPMAVIGETPNVAARLQEIADPNSLVIGPLTHRLVETSVACRLLGERRLKGMPRPISVYQAIADAARGPRLDTATLDASPPIVDREREQAILLERWRIAKLGEGQAVLISGEPGIGKSELVRALRQSLSGEVCRWVVYACSPYFTNSALHPIVTQIQRMLHINPDDPLEDRVNKLEVELLPLSRTHPDAVPLFAQLLSIPLPDRFLPLKLSPQAQRRRTLDIVATWILRQSLAQPLIFLVEDVHWADASTRDLIGLLIQRVGANKAMVLLTFRSDLTPQWQPDGNVTAMEIDRLGRRDIAGMIDRVTHGRALPAPVFEHVVEKTGGVPLFVEELSKTLLESGYLSSRGDRLEISGTRPPDAIPATLRDSLMARLDRLKEAKIVAQLAAILGQTFPYWLLQSIAPMNEADLQTHLAQLVRSEVLSQTGIAPNAQYAFRHALIQDAAYQSLLISRRQEFHRRIAGAYVDNRSDIVSKNPELIAHHLTLAGQTDEAIEYWQQAGLRASARSANVEAIAHFGKAIELLRSTPENPERPRRELALQIELGACLMAARGYAAPEVESTFAQARELCRHVGETRQLFRALKGLQSFYVVRGRIAVAHELGEQLLRVAQRTSDRSHLVEAHRRLGLCLFFRGEFQAAQSHYNDALLQITPGLQLDPAIYGNDPEVLGLSNLAWLEWFLGYPDKALHRSEGALVIAQGRGHALSLAYALGICAFVHQLRGEHSETAKRADALMALGQEQGFPYWAAWAQILGGWAATMLGDMGGGIRRLQDGLESYRATGANQIRPYGLVLLAEALGRAGEIERAIGALSAPGLDADNEVRFYDAEVLRVRGELQARRGDPQSETAALFGDAIAISRRQHAKSLELRAAVSRARLEIERGQGQQAHEALREIYTWFKEGADTVDLRAAKTLLNSRPSQNAAPEPGGKKTRRTGPR